MSKAIGRPTKYKKEYCDMLIAHCSEGLSFESFSAKIGTHRETMYGWCEKFPDFSDAKKKAFELYHAYWEALLREAVIHPKSINVTPIIFALKARFGWRENDKLTIEATSKITIDLDDSNL